MIQFHETIRGKRFFDGQLPALIKALERIADALEKQNESKMKVRRISDYEDRR